VQGRWALDFEDELRMNIAIFVFKWLCYIAFSMVYSSWFVKQYGIHAVWSTQGMEKSHYQAKISFHKHTQHSGTAKHHSAIVQTFEWWYRVV
jgi:hypothetical protein